MVRSCAIYDCTHSTRNNVCTHFGFPGNDEKMLRQWVKLSGNETLVHLPKKTLVRDRAVCEHHFTNADITIKNGKKKLMPAACPSILIPPEERFLSEDQLKLLLRELPLIQTTATIEKVETNVLHNLIDRRLDSSLTEKSSMNANNTSKKKRVNLAKITENTTAVEATAPSVRVDTSDTSNPSTPAPKKSRKELDLPVFQENLNFEFQAERNQTDNYQLDSIDVIDTLTPTDLEQLNQSVVLNPCTPAPNKSEKRTDFSVLMEGLNSEFQAERKQTVNDELDSIEFIDAPIPVDVPGTSQSAERNHTNNQLDSSSIIDTPVSSNVAKPTRPGNRYSSSVTTRLTNESSLHSLLLRGSINQLKILMRLRTIRTRKTLPTLLKIHKLIGELLQ